VRQRQRTPGDVDEAARQGEGIDDRRVQHREGEAGGGLAGDAGKTAGDAGHIGADIGVLVDAAELLDDLGMLLLPELLRLFRRHEDLGLDRRGTRGGKADGQASRSQQVEHQRPLKLAARFSTKLAMPSFTSSLAISIFWVSWKSATAAAGPCSRASRALRRVAATASGAWAAIVCAIFIAASNCPPGSATSWTNSSRSAVATSNSSPVSR